MFKSVICKSLTGISGLPRMTRQVLPSATIINNAAHHNMHKKMRGSIADYPISKPPAYINYNSPETIAVVANDKGLSSVKSTTGYFLTSRSNVVKYIYHGDMHINIDDQRVSLADRTAVNVISDLCYSVGDPYTFCFSVEHVLTKLLQAAKLSLDQHCTTYTAVTLLENCKTISDVVKCDMQSLAVIYGVKIISYKIVEVCKMSENTVEPYSVKFTIKPSDRTTEASSAVKPIFDVTVYPASITNTFHTI